MKVPYAIAVLGLLTVVALGSVLFAVGDPALWWFAAAIAAYGVTVFLILAVDFWMQS